MNLRKAFDAVSHCIRFDDETFIEFNCHIDISEDIVKNIWKKNEEMKWRLSEKSHKSAVCELNCYNWPMVHTRGTRFSTFANNFCDVNMVVNIYGESPRTAAIDCGKSIIRENFYSLLKLIGATLPKYSQDGIIGSTRSRYIDLYFRWWIYEKSKNRVLQFEKIDLRYFSQINCLFKC